MSFVLGSSGTAKCTTSQATKLHVTNYVRQRRGWMGTRDWSMSRAQIFHQLIRLVTFLNFTLFANGFNANRSNGKQAMSSAALCLAHRFFSVGPKV